MANRNVVLVNSWRKKGSDWKIETRVTCKSQISTFTAARQLCLPASDRIEWELNHPNVQLLREGERKMWRVCLCLGASDCDGVSECDGVCMDVCVWVWSERISLSEWEKQLTVYLWREIDTHIVSVILLMSLSVCLIEWVHVYRWEREKEKQRYLKGNSLRERERERRRQRERVRETERETCRVRACESERVREWGRERKKERQTEREGERKSSQPKRGRRNAWKLCDKI